MINLEHVRLRIDGQRHVALEYWRHGAQSKFIHFTAYGLETSTASTSEFERQYSSALDKPVGAAALRLLELSSSAYLNEDGVLTTLLEIYLMTTANTTDLVAMNMVQLMVVYDGLCTAAGTKPVKKFESKAKAISAIQALGGAAVTPTAKQQDNKATKDAATAKRIEKLKAAKPPKEEKAKPATKSTKPVGKGAAAAKLNKKADAVVGDKAPRGLGIGAFCKELIIAGKSNEEVLTAATKKFPDNKTSAASVAWYRNKLKSEGAIA